MLIPESMTFVLVLGAVLGSIFTVFILFLIGLLYRLDCVHLYADEVNFSFKKPTEPAE